MCFRCVVELQAAINRFVAETNNNPKPFAWTADPDKIIAAVRRGHQVLESIHLLAQRLFCLRRSGTKVTEPLFHVFTTLQRLV